MQTAIKLNMQTCVDIITESAIHPFTANVEFGSVYFFLHEEDYNHVLANQDLIREVISPKYQLLFIDFGKKTIVITLTRNLVCL
jgi:hypothetical protein